MRNKAGKILALIVFGIFLAGLIYAGNAIAISEATLEWYAANNIMFVNPSKGKKCSSDADTTATVEGSEIAEKIWNGLKSLGVTDEVAAGIMGNMSAESGLNPARHETSKYKKHWPMALNTNKQYSYGIGLIQWSFGRRIKLYNYIAEHSDGLAEKFFDHPEDYGLVRGVGFLEKVQENGVEEDADKFIALELDYLIIEEMEKYPYYKKVFDETTVKGAAQQFSIRVEGCANCRDVNNQSVKNRAAMAQGWYDKYHGTHGSGGTGEGRDSGDGDTGNDGNTGDGNTGDGNTGNDAASDCVDEDGDGYDDSQEGDGDDEEGGGDEGEGGYQGDDYTYTGDVDSLQHLVKEWAWAERTHKPKNEQKPGYKAYRKSGKPRCGGCGGNDCAGFVYGVIVNSGWDKNLPGCGVRNMQDSLYRSSTWKEVTSQISGNGDMKPGDIIICSHTAAHSNSKCKNSSTGHVMLWSGPMSGFPSPISSASYHYTDCTQSRAPSASTRDNIMHYINGGYSIYRKVK